MMKFGFVILHYISIDTTVRCIESIIEKIDSKDYQIIVVDNASPNGTGIQLKEKYADNAVVSVVLNKTNLGYSAGNNVGIKYAVNELKCDFVVIMNNDTQIIQDNFTTVVLKEYNTSKFAVLGPQVFDPEGHNDSSPIKGNHPMSEKEALCWLRMWQKQYLKSILRLSDFHPHRQSERNSQITVENDLVGAGTRQEDVMLHGCCLVLSPIYLEKFDGLAEFSFMYLEEPALLYRLRKHNMLAVYNPELKIFHEEAVSTNMTAKNDRIRIKRMIMASKGLLRYYKTN